MMTSLLFFPFITIEFPSQTANIFPLFFTFPGIPLLVTFAVPKASSCQQAIFEKIYYTDIIFILPPQTKFSRQRTVLFIYTLFNEQQTGKDVEGGCCGLSQGSNPSIHLEELRKTI